MLSKVDNVRETSSTYQMLNESIGSTKSGAVDKVRTIFSVVLYYYSLLETDTILTQTFVPCILCKVYEY